MKYRLFTPSVTHSSIHEAGHQVGHYPYNHDVSVERFNGKFYAAWNAHPDTHEEGALGQINVIAESDDFVHWQQPSEFLGASAENGVCSPGGVMWQPNLMNYKNKTLWCFWCLTHKEGKNWPLKHSGTYFSYLSNEPESRWVNVKILDRYMIDGKNALAFPSQNPFLCSNGRVLVPVTFIHAPEDDHQKSQHWNAALYSDDEGETWQVSSVLSQPSDSWANWEPHFSEQTDGKVRAFMRNMSRSLPLSPHYWLLTAESRNNEKWQPLVFDKEPIYSCMETANSRMHVFKMDRGNYCMLHHDCIVNHGTYDSRYNLALFFSRTGKDDYIPATQFSRKNIISSYPQGVAHEGKIYVAYTIGSAGELRSIEGAIIDRQPDPSQWMIYPRGKDRVELDVRKDKDGITCARRLNPEFTPAVGRQVFRDNRACLLFQEGASASVDIPLVDFSRQESLELKFKTKVLKSASRQYVILCSMGAENPIRIGIPANRDQLLYAYGDEQWQNVGAFPLEAWIDVKAVFYADYFTVQIGDNDVVRFGNPAYAPELKLFFGDGFDSDYMLNNQGGEFLIDLDSISTSGASAATGDPL